MTPQRPISDSVSLEQTQAFVQATLADLRQAQEMFHIVVDPAVVDNLIFALERISS